MTRLILHAGGHKTGTTSLQALLLHNRALLEQHGISLAAGFHPTEGHHHSLVQLLEQGQLEQFMGALSTTGHPVVIVSTEVFYRLLARRHPVLELLSPLLAKRFEVITTVLVARRQDFLKESLFAEVVGRWFSGDIRDENHYLYDYRHAAGRLVELFGAEAFRLGVYRDDIPGWDSPAEVLALAGLGEVAALFEPVPRQRVSADRRVLQILSSLGTADRALRVDAQRLIAEAGSLQPDPVKHLLSPVERQQFLARYRKANRELARAYRPDAEAYLTGEVELPEEWQPPALFSPAEVAGIVAAAVRGRHGLG